MFFHSLFIVKATHPIDEQTRQRILLRVGNLTAFVALMVHRMRERREIGFLFRVVPLIFLLHKNARIGLLEVVDIALSTEELAAVELIALEKRIYDAKVRLERIQVAEVQCNKLKDEWRTQASYLILTKELMDEQQTDFSLLLRALDKQVLKDFVQATIQNIVIKDRRIEQITLMSGITHEFVYGNETKKEG